VNSDGTANWRRDDESLVRDLTFKDFTAALAFVERVGQMAVDYERRPDMCISEFNRVRLTIANHHGSGLTEAERRLAARTDAVVEDYFASQTNCSST
jgi:4a-hydroxytetrahydrobiopterin dehydratase